MRVLFLSPRQCWPLDSGRRLREFHLAKAISRGAELTILAFGEPGQDRGDLSFCELVTVPLPPRYTALKLLQGMLTSTPLPVLNYTAEPLKRCLQELLARRRFDLIQIESIAMTGYLPLLEASVPTSRIVYNWHDIESDRMERYRQQTRSPAHRMYANLTSKRLRRVETSILTSSAKHLVCSEHDRQRLASFAPGSHLEVVPNGVDVDSFLPPPLGQAGHRLLFVGAMNYDPNVQAATEFVHRVWPRLRPLYPRLRFTIVGSNPSPAVLALGDYDGVEVTGTVPDVRPYYLEAFAVVVPLRVGGGTRLKILEALAAGVPVISTAIGAEGLAVTNGEHLLLAEEPVQWETALDRLSLDMSLRSTLRQAGLALVREHYDWQAIGRKLLASYANLAAGSPH